MCCLQWYSNCASVEPCSTCMQPPSIWMRSFAGIAALEKFSSTATSKVQVESPYCYSKLCLWAPQSASLSVHSLTWMRSPALQVWLFFFHQSTQVNCSRRHICIRNKYSYLRVGVSICISLCFCYCYSSCISSCDRLVTSADGAAQRGRNDLQLQHNAFVSLNPWLYLHLYLCLLDVFVF